MTAAAFADTQPASISALSGRAIDDYRIDDGDEIHALLRRLLDGGTLVHLNAPGGASCISVLWALDGRTQRIALDADPRHSAVRAIVDAGEATAVAYLDAIKLQFELHGLVLVHGATGSALQASWPRHLYRFQRRASFRVRTSGGACVQLRHPARPDQPVVLRVLDISLGGVALALPADMPELAVGTTIADVRLELDADTQLQTALTVQHVGAPGSGANPVRRVGCAFSPMPAQTQRSLQRFIDLTQRRQRMLT